MKNLLLCICVLIGGLMFVTSLFGGGRVMVFGLPVSGLLFAVLIRAALREMKR